MAVKQPATPRDLEKTLKTGTLSPVYLLHGAEERAVASAIKTIRAEIEKTSDPSTAWRTYDLAENSFAECMEDMRTVSFFSTRRGVLLTGLVKRTAAREPDKRDETEQEDEPGDKSLRLDEASQKTLLNYCENPSPDVVLVIVPGKIDARLKFWKAVSSNAVAVSFNPDEGDKKAIIAQMLGDSGLDFIPEAREWMIERFTSNFAYIESELQKLETYMGGIKRVTLSDLEACMAVPRTENVFKLVDAIAERRTQGMLTALGSLRRHGEILLPVMGMVIRQFRMLLIIRSMKDQKHQDNEIMARCGIKSPWVYTNKYLPHVKAMSVGHLKKIIIALSDIDFRIKSSGLNDWMVLEQELIALVGGTFHRTAL